MIDEPEIFKAACRDLVTLVSDEEDSYSAVATLVDQINSYLVSALAESETALIADIEEADAIGTPLHLMQLLRKWKPPLGLSDPSLTVKIVRAIQQTNPSDPSLMNRKEINRMVVFIAGVEDIAPAWREYALEKAVNMFLSENEDESSEGDEVSSSDEFLTLFKYQCVSEWFFIGLLARTVVEDPENLCKASFFFHMLLGSGEKRAKLFSIIFSEIAPYYSDDSDKNFDPDAPHGTWENVDLAIVLALVEYLEVLKENASEQEVELAVHILEFMFQSPDSVTEEDDLVGRIIKSTGAKAVKFYDKLIPFYLCTGEYFESAVVARMIALGGESAAKAVLPEFTGNTWCFFFDSRATTQIVESMLVLKNSHFIDQLDVEKVFAVAVQEVLKRQRYGEILTAFANLHLFDSSSNEFIECVFNHVYETATVYLEHADSYTPVSCAVDSLARLVRFNNCTTIPTLRPGSLTFVDLLLYGAFYDLYPAPQTLIPALTDSLTKADVTAAEFVCAFNLIRSLDGLADLPPPPVTLAEAAWVQDVVTIARLNNKPEDKRWTQILQKFHENTAEECAFLVRPSVKIVMSTFSGRPTFLAERLALASREVASAGLCVGSIQVILDLALTVLR